MENYVTSLAAFEDSVKSTVVQVERKTFSISFRFSFHLIRKSTNCGTKAADVLANFFAGKL